MLLLLCNAQGRISTMPLQRQVAESQQTSFISLVILSNRSKSLPITQSCLRRPCAGS